MNVSKAKRDLVLSEVLLFGNRWLKKLELAASSVSFQIEKNLLASPSVLEQTKNVTQNASMTRSNVNLRYAEIQAFLLSDSHHVTVVGQSEDLNSIS